MSAEERGAASFERSFRLLWHEITLTADSEEVLEAVEALWVVPEQSLVPRWRAHFELRGVHPTAVYENGDLLADGVPLRRLFGLLHGRIHQRVAEVASRQGWVRLHAATVDIDERRVVFVGPSAAGKTTTALRIALQGGAFIGDECALVRAGHAVALPRFAHVKRGAQAFLPELADHITASPPIPERDAEDDGPEAVMLDPRRVVTPWRNHERPVDQIVYLLGYGAQERTVLAPDRAVLYLSHQVTRFLEPKAHVIATLAGLLRRPALALRVPSAELVLPALREHLA